MPLKSSKLLLAIAPFAIASSTPTLPPRSPIPPASPSSPSSTLSSASSLASPLPPLTPSPIPSPLTSTTSNPLCESSPTHLSLPSSASASPFTPPPMLTSSLPSATPPPGSLSPIATPITSLGLVPRVSAPTLSASLLPPTLPTPLPLPPILFDFSSLLADEAASRMVNEFDAIETNFFIGSDLFEELEGWVGVRPKESKVYEIKIDLGCGAEGVVPLGVVEHGGELGSKDRVFGSLILKMSLRRGGDKFLYDGVDCDSVGD